MEECNSVNVNEEIERLCIELDIPLETVNRLILYTRGLPEIDIDIKMKSLYYSKLKGGNLN